MELVDIRNLFYRTFNQNIDRIEPISAHGSSRKYFRCFVSNETYLAAYNNDVKENIAFLDYAEQLLNKGIAVPKIYAKDIEKGIYILEDLGNTTLFDFIQLKDKGDISKEKLEGLYYKVIRTLPKIQIVGGTGFDYSNAYPRKAFDRQSIAWDLNYFKYYFLKLAGINYDEQDLENDFLTLTNHLLESDCEYFLFRDFQSRNIMVKEGEVFLIDFQGGRKGALEYDLASLLYDGKANLSPEFREELLDLYIQEVKNYIHIDEQKFRKSFYAYVYIRIMQAMGAYGFRGYFEKKEHFLKSIPFALDNIEWLQTNIELSINLPTLNRVLKEMTSLKALRNLSKNQLTINIKSFSYKKGYPHDTSGNGGGFVFDCRAIHNPGRYDELKKLTGKDRGVMEFLEREEDAKAFFTNVLSIVLQSVEVYTKRNFTSLSVYFGCTGGQHRSVYFAEKLSKYLYQNTDINIIVEHLEQK